MRSLIWMGILVAAGACGSVDKTDPDAAIDATGDTAVVEFDAPTTIDAPIDAVPTDAFSCTPNEFQACAGSSAVVCNAAGTGTTMTDCGAPGCNATAGRCNMCIPNNSICVGSTVGNCGPDGLPAGSETCALSCNPTPTAHCTYLQPVYLPNVCDTPSTATFTPQTGTIDTSIDTNCTGGIVAQAGGPPICVIRASTMTVGAAVAMTFTGGRAVALVTDGLLEVRGTIDVAATSTTNGPGGGTRVVSGSPSATQGGGGGGGFVAGGSGGSTTATGGGHAGGPVFDPLSSAALLGGQRGAVPMLGVIGGGGGGAMTLISCRGRVQVSGTIDAGGGGGNGGRDLVAGPQLSFISGGGGGAGGYVVLQGLAVTATGSFFANGGGGGGGNSVNDATGNPGADGSRSATLGAPGGPLNGSASGAGGAGAAGTGAPGPGVVGTSSPGGGGGATGRFQSYTPLGVNPTLTPAAVSPRFETNANTATR